MDLYNIKVDVKNFISKNLKTVIFINVLIIVGGVLGCIVALSGNVQTVFETSGNVYFVYLSDVDGGGIVVSVFVSAILYIVLLVLSKANKITCKLAVILLCYRAYEVFHRMAVIMVYFGLKAFLPSLIVCVAELLFCILLEVLYLLNNSEKRTLCKDWITEEYLINAGVIALICLIVNIVLCLSFGILNLFT
ncbi:MAG: hypothetical protein J6C23_01010 [Clostridia bacterium]|nr:hypothetical protein [Clostridia bacterium]